MSGESEDISGHPIDSQVQEPSGESSQDSIPSSSASNSHHRKSDEPPSKRLKPTTDDDDDDSQKTDRLSTLHEPLILYILSFLPILDSIRTGVLSKRWRSLWTSLPTLRFNHRHIQGLDDDEEEEEGDNISSDLPNFIQMVDKTLVMCSNSVKHLGVKCSYNKQFALNADSWAQFASRNGVEKFELEFHESESYLPVDDTYVLPQSLCTNSNFKELRFSLCRFRQDTSVAWNSLKKLSIGYIDLSGGVIERILAGTPVLEMLEVYYFEGCNFFHIGNSSVKKLILREPWRHMCRRVYPLEITAPNVRSLEISGDFPDCKLLDVTSLVEAALFDLYLQPYEGDSLVNMARKLLDSVAHVKILTLGSWAIRGLAVLHEEHVALNPPLLKCKSLTINTEMSNSHPLGIAVLLRYFPLVQTFTLSGSPSPVIDRWISQGHHHDPSPLGRVEEDYVMSPTPLSGFGLLKTVKLLDFWIYSVSSLQFVRILLNDARMLQKIVIDTGKRNSYFCSRKYLFKAGQKILSFPRSSPEAELFVYE